MHFHDKDRVEVFVTGGTLKVRTADGKIDMQTVSAWSARFGRRREERFRRGRWRSDPGGDVRVETEEIAIACSSTCASRRGSDGRRRASRLDVYNVFNGPDGVVYDAFQSAQGFWGPT